MDIDVANSSNEIEPMTFMKMLMSVDENRLRMVPESALMVSQVARLVVTILVGKSSRTAVTVRALVYVCAHVILKTNNMMSLTSDPYVSSERRISGFFLSSISVGAPTLSHVSVVSLLRWS